MADCNPDILGDHIAMVDTPDATQIRLADNLISALVDFFVAANNGTASIAQRETLKTALANADALPDDVYIEAVNKARLQVGMR